MNTPITTASNGQFQRGNQAAVGRSSRSQKLRAAVLSAISKDDIQAITAKLVSMATDGDLSAAKLLLGFIGKTAVDSQRVPTVAVQANVVATPPERIISHADESNEDFALAFYEHLKARGVLDEDGNAIVDPDGDT